jgi:hypothetical protein
MPPAQSTPHQRSVASAACKRCSGHPVVRPGDPSWPATELQKSPQQLAGQPVRKRFGRRFGVGVVDAAAADERAAGFTPANAPGPTLKACEKPIRAGRSVGSPIRAPRAESTRSAQTAGKTVAAAARDGAFWPTAIRASHHWATERFGLPIPWTMRSAPGIAGP